MQRERKKELNQYRHPLHETNQTNSFELGAFSKDTAVSCIRCYVGRLWGTRPDDGELKAGHGGW